MTGVTKREMREELEREIRIRERCFPGWVATGKISKEEADRRLAVLRAVLIHVQTCETIREAPPAPERQGALFR